MSSRPSTSSSLPASKPNAAPWVTADRHHHYNSGAPTFATMPASPNRQHIKRSQQQQQQISSLSAAAAAARASHPSSSRTSPNMPVGDGWWEHVLPEGQLAERLRRAHHDPGHSSNSTIGRKEGAEIMNRRNSHAPVTGLFAFPSTTSSSAATSSDEDSIHPDRISGKAALHHATRSNHVFGERRQRVQSAADHYTHAGLISAMSRSQTAHALSSSSSTDSQFGTRQPFGISGHQFLPLSGTPEYSSEEEADVHDKAGLTRSQSVQSTVRHLQQRTTRTTSSSNSSSTSTRVRKPAASIHGLSEQAWNDVLSSRRLPPHSSQQTVSHGRTGGARRVSFDADAEAKARSDEGDEMERQRQRFLRDVARESATLERSGTAASSQVNNPLEDLALEGSQHWFNSTSSGPTTRRRTRTLSKDGFGNAYPSRTHRRSGSAISAPVSPRTSMFLDDRQRTKFMQPLVELRGEAKTAGSHQHFNPSRPRSATPPMSAGPKAHEAAVLRSLQSAHQHITRTTSSALTYSRSILAVPAPVLRPLMQVTMFWWVSSATVLVLATCLLASYMLTVWDDMSGRKVKGDRDARATPSSTTNASSSRRSSLVGATAAQALDSLVLNPLHTVARVPIAVAKSLTPRAVPTPAASRRSSLSEQHVGSSDEEESDATSSGPAGEPSTSTRRNKTKPGPMPPRPPLASLIPSMFFTLLLALGAGIVGGWMKKRQTESAAAAAAATAATADRSAASPAVSPRVGGSTRPVGYATPSPYDTTMAY